MVVFPLVPVIAMISPAPNVYASSISPHILTPLSRKELTIGMSVGTPGLSTATSNSSICSSVRSPKISGTSLSFGAFS